jgi:hypothetical protein
MPDLVEDTARDTAKVLAEDTVWDLIMDRMVATAPDTVAATAPAGSKLQQPLKNGNTNYPSPYKGERDSFFVTPTRHGGRTFGPPAL